MNTGLSFVCRGEDNFKDNSRHYMCCPIVLSFSLYIFFLLWFFTLFFPLVSGLISRGSSVLFVLFFFVLGFSFVCVFLGFFPLSCPFFFPCLCCVPPSFQSPFFPPPIEVAFYPVFIRPEADRRCNGRQ